MSGGQIGNFDNNLFPSGSFSDRLLIYGNMHDASMVVHSYYPETYIGIALCTIPHDIRFLAAAIVTVGIPTAAFDDK